jgi:RNA recognition motif-containing protein
LRILGQNDFLCLGCCFFPLFSTKSINFFLFFLMNIYISNLSFKVEDNDLEQLFKEYGEVSSAKVITDRYTGRSRGFGFVEMPDNEAAQKAINELHQAEYDGKVINVNEARPKEDRPQRSGGGGYGGGGGRGGHGGGDRRRGGGGGGGFRSSY